MERGAWKNPEPRKNTFQQKNPFVAKGGKKRGNRLEPVVRRTSEVRDFLRSGEGARRGSSQKETDPKRVSKSPLCWVAGTAPRKGFKENWKSYSRGLIKRRGLLAKVGGEEGDLWLEGWNP